MDESSETQNLNIFAYKKKVKNSFLQHCAPASPNKLTEQELIFEPSNQPQNNHFNFNFEKWDILLDNTRQNSIDQASSPANKVISAAIQEGDCKLSQLKNFAPNHDPLKHDKVDYNNKENLIFTTDYQYQTPNHHHAKKESFDSVNLLSKSTTGTEKTHLDVILEEFSPQMEYHDQHQETGPELLIQIDVVQVSKSFAEYARKKVPRYIKKMQKHIKKIGHHLKHFDLEKDGLMELKNEVRNIHSWNSPWTYSRILLYMTNLLTYFKYKYRVDNDKFGDKLFKKVFKLVTKSYFYARQIIKSLFITFNPEEIEAFERLKTEYQVFLEQRGTGEGGQNNGVFDELVKKEKSKKKKKKKHSRKEKDDSDDEDEDESRKLKKLKVEQQDQRSEFQAEEEEEDDDLWRAEPKQKKEKKAKRNFDIKSILNKRRKKKKRMRNSNGETEVEKQAAIDLDNYFDKLASYFHSTHHIAEKMNNVLKTWKSHQQQQQPLEEIIISKPEKTGPAIWEEVNQPQNQVPSLDFPSFSLHLNPKFKKANPSLVFSGAGQREENENQIEIKIQQQQQRQSSLSSIFKLETISPEIMKINKKITLPDVGKFLFHKKLARKTTAFFFTNSISQKLHGYLKWKGIDYQLNTQRMEREILEKLVLLKFEFKLAEDEEEDDCENNFTLGLNVQNKFSVESFNSFLNISSQIKSERFAIQEYPELFSLGQMRNKTFGVVCAEKILEQLQTEPWRFDPSSALYYYTQLLQDEEGHDYYELGVFTIVENFFDFHICFNEKQLF